MHKLSVYCSVLLLLAAAPFAASAHGQQILLSNGATIDYLVEGPQSVTSCPRGSAELFIDKWTYQITSYADATGIILPFTYNPETSITRNCNGSWTSGGEVTPRNAAVAIAFTPEAGPSVTASILAVNGYVGWINPKYVVMGVYYAPPGIGTSNATYSSNTVTGSTISQSQSFTDATTVTISLAWEGSIPGFTTTKTYTSSSTYSQELETSSSVAVSQTASASRAITGCANPATDSGVPPGGLDHDCDYIFVWLNPVASYVASGSGSTVTLLGYGFDLTDTHTYNDLDVVGIPVGCLNGDFTNNPYWGPTCNDIITGPLARSWAADNTDGSGPGLTASDLAVILKADPFYQSYTPDLTPGTYTTTDGRFTECNTSECTETLDFEPDVNNSYSQGYSTTATNQETATYKWSQSFSVQNQFKGTGSSFWGGINVAIGESNMFTQENVFSQTTNNSNGQTASFQIDGPPAGYTGPTQFVAWQDDLYGTFMFFPVAQ